MGDKKNIKFWSEHLNGSNHLGDLEIYGRILKTDLKETGWKV
jgi:hypothetical protein